MGKRGKKKENKGDVATRRMSIREEASGRKQTQNPKSLLKLNHLQNCAIWSSGFPQFCNLPAFFGHFYADFAQSLGIPTHPSLFSCQRCETILQPGVNCTIRIEKNRPKRHKRSKLKTPPQNNVVYTCHFCSHRNLKRGTPKGYVKQIAPSITNPLKNEPVMASTIQKCTSTSEKISATPSVGVNTPVTLVDSKKRKRRKPGAKGSSDEVLVSTAPGQVENVGGTSKKKRKAWTTVKEIAENEERERSRRFKNFSIPFVL